MVKSDVFRIRRLCSLTIVLLFTCSDRSMNQDGSIIADNVVQDTIITDSVVQDTSISVDTVIQDTSISADSVVQDGSISADTVVQDVSTIVDSVVQDTSISADSSVRDIAIDGSPATQPPVTGDADGDGCVGYSDYTEVTTSYGPVTPANQASDLNYDQVVNYYDVLVVIQHWGNPC